jgi:hypothetical protein
MRASPPCASREATSVESSVSAKRSYDHSSAGALGQLGQRPRRRGRFQGAEEEGELGALGHAGISAS